MQTEIKILKANNGDCILVKSFDKEGNDFNILIDGGLSKTFDFHLRKEFIGEKSINIVHLLVLTHIHSDHIAGIIKLLKSNIFERIEIQRYWINCKDLIQIVHGNNISFNQGIKLEKVLIEKEESKEKWSDIVCIESNLDPFTNGIEIEVLSPTKDLLSELYKKWPEISKNFKKQLEDIAISGISSSQIKRGSLINLANEPFSPQKNLIGDIENSSSIALYLKLLDCNLLLLGDARAEVIKQSIEGKGYWCEYKLSDSSIKTLETQSVPKEVISKLVPIINTPIKNSECFRNKIKEQLDKDEYCYINEVYNSAVIHNSNKIKADYVKVSHHGSINNTSCELLDLIDCDNYIISTNGYRHKHPDRETVARIIHHKGRDYSNKRILYFNYSMKEIERNAGKLFESIDFTDANWGYKENANKL